MNVNILTGNPFLSEHLSFLQIFKTLEIHSLISDVDWAIMEVDKDRLLCVVMESRLQ